MEKIKKFFGVLQEMENTKINRPTVSELTDNNEVKMDLLVMNLLSDKLLMISELKNLIDEHGDSIIISTMPITKYRGDIYVMKYHFTIETIKNLINGVGKEKVIIYSNVDDLELNKGPFKYRCAVVVDGGNVNHTETIKYDNAQDLLKDFKENWFFDETNTGIAKEHYKEEGFKQTILFKIGRNELDENYFEECLNKIKPLLNNENLVVCNTPIVRYQKNSYVVDDITDIETIKTSIKNGHIVLLYTPIFVDGELKYKTCTILKMNNNLDLLTEINKSSAKLIKKGVEFGADSIDVGEEMLEILKSLKYFHLKSNDNHEHIGTLVGRYFIYLKEKTPKNQIIVYNKNSPHREMIRIINDDNDNKIKEIYTNIIYNKPIPVTEFKLTSPMMNPITYELINPESWEDGLYLSPNLMDENLKINMVYEVKCGKVIRVYKNLTK